MEAKVLFDKALAAANHCIVHVHEHQLANETPCTEWDLKKLLNHMVYEVLWIPDVLAGKTIDEVGDAYDGDVLGKDFHAAWHKAAENAHAAVAVANPSDLVHLSYADLPADSYITEVGGDIMLHTWDVAQSMKCNLMFDQALSSAVYHSVLPKKDSFARSGLFGKPFKVPKTADIQTKLLALVGRKAKTV